MNRIKLRVEIVIKVWGDTWYISLGNSSFLLGLTLESTVSAYSSIKPAWVVALCFGFVRAFFGLLCAF